MQDAWINVNGSLVLGSEAKISPYDHGFLYGHGLFETMRVYNGKIFCLDEHLQRLYDSSKVLEWPEWFDANELSSAIYQTVEKNKLQDASVRLTVSRGNGASRPDAATCSSPTIIVFASPAQSLSSEVYDQGWNLVTGSIRRNLTSPLCGIKAANYLDNMLAKAEVRQKGANEALLLNTNGSVAEGTMCNIFVVVKGRLITPDRFSGLLPGITRATVLKLAWQAGIIMEERQVWPDELLGASEMFITSSLIEIMPITMLDGNIINDRRPGRITQILRNGYRELVQRTCY